MRATRTRMDTMKRQRRHEKGTRLSLMEGAEAENLISKADRVRGISFLQGMVVGSILGVPTSIALGFLGRPGEGPPTGDFIGWLIEGLSFFSFSIFFGCLIAFVSSIYLWRRRERDVNLRIGILSSLTVLFIWLYLGLVMSFIFEPFNNFFLQYYHPVSIFWLGALVFFPFMLLSAYMLFPSIRPIISNNLRVLYTRQSWKNPRVRKKVKTIWLLLIATIAVYILNLLWNLL